MCTRRDTDKLLGQYILDEHIRLESVGVNASRGRAIFQRFQRDHHSHLEQHDPTRINQASLEPAAFSSQINLEPPSSVLPPSITPLSASSIVAPSSFTPVLPASGDVSSIVAPGGTSVPTVGATPSSGTGTIVPPTSSVVPPGGSSGGIVKPGGVGAVVKPLYNFEGEFGGVCDSNVQYSEIVKDGRVDDPEECLRPRDLDAFNKSKQLENEAKTGGDSASRGKAREEVEFRDAQILAGYMCYKEGGGSESARGNCKDYVARMRKSPMYDSIGSSPAMWINMQGDLSAGRLGRERLEALTWVFENTKLELRGNRQVLVGVGRNGGPATITLPSYLLGTVATGVGTTAISAARTGMGIGYSRVIIGATGALTLLTLTGDSGPWYEGMSSRDAVTIAGLLGTLFDENSKQAKGNASSQAGSVAASGSPNPNDPCGKPNLKGSNSNSAGDRLAQRAQYEDAHAFKKEIVGNNGSLFNMKVDVETGRIWLEPLQKGGIPIPTNYNRDGDNIGERNPEKGDC